MTIPKQAFLYPIELTGSTVNVRYRTEAAQTGNLSGAYDPNQIYFISGDTLSGSGKNDFLRLFQNVLNTNIHGITCSVSLTYDNEVVVSSSTPIRIDFSSSNTGHNLHTLLGFPYAEYPDTWTNVWTAPSQSLGAWLPSNPKAFDTYDEPFVVGNKQFAVSGEWAANDFTGGIKKRTITFEWLPLSDILTEHRTNNPSSSMETFWASGRTNDFRYYDNREDRSGWKNYTLEDFTRPWERNGGTRQIRYDVALNLHGGDAQNEGNFLLYQEDLPPPFIFAYTRTPATSSVTASVELEWEVDNANYVSIDQDVGDFLPTTHSLYITSSDAGTINYTLTAVGPGGTVSASQSVLWLADTGGPPSLSIFEEHTWDLVYLPKDINETTWTWEPSVYPGADRTAFTLEHKGTSGNRPITSQSSAPLVSSALGVDVENLGVRMNTNSGSDTTSGMASLSASQTWSFATEATSVLHYRALIYQHATTNGRRVWNWQESPTKYHRSVESTTDRWTINIRDDADGTNYSQATPSNAVTGGAYYLCDWIVRPQGVSLYMNGVSLVEYTNSEVIAAVPSSSLLGLLGAHNGQVSSETTLYWFGVRDLGVSGSYSIAEHADHVSASFGL